MTFDYESSQMMLEATRERIAATRTFCREVAGIIAATEEATVASWRVLRSNHPLMETTFYMNACRMSGGNDPSLSPDEEPIEAAEQHRHDGSMFPDDAG